MITWKGAISNGDLAHFCLHVHLNEDKKLICTLKILALTEHPDDYDCSAWRIVRKFYDKFVMASRITMAGSTLRTIVT